MERTFTNKLTCKFQVFILQGDFFIDVVTWKNLKEKRKFCLPVKLQWLSIEILVILQVFKL